MDFFEYLSFGTRIYAYGKWWIRINNPSKNIYLVVDSQAIMPAPILLVYQNEKDKKYQEILFRRFVK